MDLTSEGDASEMPWDNCSLRKGRSATRWFASSSPRTIDSNPGCVTPSENHLTGLESTSLLAVSNERATSSTETDDLRTNAGSSLAVGTFARQNGAVAQ